MDELLNPQNLRSRAFVFAKGATTCASPKAQAIFIRIAKNLVALADELEVRDCGHGLKVWNG